MPSNELTALQKSRRAGRIMNILFSIFFGVAMWYTGTLRNERDRVRTEAATWEAAYREASASLVRCEGDFCPVREAHCEEALLRLIRASGPTGSGVGEAACSFREEQCAAGIRTMGRWEDELRDEVRRLELALTACDGIPRGGTSSFLYTAGRARVPSDSE